MIGLYGAQLEIFVFKYNTCNFYVTPPKPNIIPATIYTVAIIKILFYLSLYMMDQFVLPAEISN